MRNKSQQKNEEKKLAATITADTRHVFGRSFDFLVDRMKEGEMGKTTPARIVRRTREKNTTATVKNAFGQSTDKVTEVSTRKSVPLRYAKKKK
jgi:hypothetical protein